jgi:hypothetical protein
MGRKGASKVTVDYTFMDGPTMLDTCRDDASKWAAAFCQIAEKLGHKGIDEGWMIGWFANAIETACDHRMGRRITVLPDGSAFFTAEIGEPAGPSG